MLKLCLNCNTCRYFDEGSWDSSAGCTFDSKVVDKKYLDDMYIKGGDGCIGWDVNKELINEYLHFFKAGEDAFYS